MVEWRYYIFITEKEFEYKCKVDGDKMKLNGIKFKERLMRGKIYHIGRDKTSNEIYIIDNSVSEKHVQIVIDENGDIIIIAVRKSNTSVKVNDVILNSPLKIVKDDVITIGSFKCVYADIYSAIRRYDFEGETFTRSCEWFDYRRAG